MTYKYRLTSIFIIAFLTALVGLTGCSSSSETPAEATPTQASSATAAPESAGNIEVVVSPTIVEETAETSTPAVEENTTTGSISQSADCSKLNLNTLTEDQLMSTIPNFSNRMVREFLEYRPYVSIQQFRREIGKYVDEAQVAEYEKYVYAPVNPNESDAETLQQLPGVDATIAEQLTGGRPYASNDAFLQALAKHVSEQQLAEAKCYLVVNP